MTDIQDELAATRFEALRAINHAAELRLALDAANAAANRMRAALVEAQYLLAPVRNVVVERALRVIKEGLVEAAPE